MSDIKVGDKVRVTYEGVVSKTERDGRTIVFDAGNQVDLFFDLDRDDIKVKVVEKAKPVVTFKPGDVVRSKTFPDQVRTIGIGGSFSHVTHRWMKHQDEMFTSDYYDKVELHEAPL